jgi:hypothetical protein
MCLTTWQRTRLLTRANTRLLLQEVLAAPFYPAWLAITGRALLTIGRVLQKAGPWLQASLLQATAGSCPAGVVTGLSAPCIALDWLCEQLRELRQDPDAPTAVQLAPGMLKELAQIAGMPLREGGCKRHCLSPPACMLRAAINRLEAHGRDPMALQYKGVY